MIGFLRRYIQDFKLMRVSITEIPIVLLVVVLFISGLAYKAVTQDLVISQINETELINYSLVTFDDFKPEPKELIQFAIFVMIPCVLSFVVLLLARCLNKSSLLISAPIVFIKLEKLMVERFGLLLLGTTLFSFYQQEYKVYDYGNSLILFLLAFSFYFNLRNFDLDQIKQCFVFRKIEHYLSEKLFILELFIVVSLSIIASLNAFSFNVKEAAIEYNLFFTLDEFAAVANGLVPGIDFYSQYSNLLPLFFKKYFNYFSASEAAFTSLMCVLVVVCLLSSYFLLLNLVKNNLIRLFVFFSLVGVFLYPIINYGNSYSFYLGNYFGVFPLRTLFPFLIALTTTLALKSNKSTYEFFVLGLLSVLAVFNNVDFGLPFVLSSLGVIAIKFIVSSISSKEFVSVLLKYFSGVIVSFFILFNCFGENLFSSNFYKNLYFYQLLFAGSGFYMLPLSLFFGWHRFVFLFYIVTIFISILRLAKFNNSDKKRTELLYCVMLSLFGLSTMVYYVGRSHWSTFLVCLPFFILLVGYILNCFYDEYSGLYAGDRKTTKATLFSILLVAFFGLANLPNFKFQIYRLIKEEKVDSAFEQDIKSLRLLFVPLQKVMLFYDMPHLYANKLGVKNLLPYANPRMVLKTQFYKIRDIMDREGIEHIYSSEYFVNIYKQFIEDEKIQIVKLADNVYKWTIKNN